MKHCPVVLIAFEEYDNLGIGYLASVLSEEGFDTRVIDFVLGKTEILKILKRLNPMIIGFSVVFEHYIREFADMISYFRKNGIACHITAGGHYASLRYKDLFEHIPSIDSVVRFEGEYILLDLVNNIYASKEWREIKGIAYRKNGEVVSNPVRPLEQDLDRFPYPMRSPLKDYAFDRKFATILAGRGCVHDCCFCDIREFYLQPSGPVKRIRKPEKIVREIELMYYEKNCSVFLFQDDDFPVRINKRSGWIERFCKELNRKGLDDKIIWKINCRPDEIDLESFTMMKEHGLFLVFIGIEDGTDIGLSRLNKHMTVGKSLEGINILKRLRIGFDYGFMPFQPASTFSSIRENFNFLRKICDNGYTPVSFLKLLPYFATNIEKELRNEGRLIGKPGSFDYKFLDESLDHYYEFITSCLLGWLRDPEGLLNVLKWARNYLLVFAHFFKTTAETRALSKNVKLITAESNRFLIDTLEGLASLFESGQNKYTNPIELKKVRENINTKHEFYKTQINELMTDLLIIAENQKQYLSVF